MDQHRRDRAGKWRRAGALAGLALALAGAVFLAGVRLGAVDALAGAPGKWKGAATLALLREDRAAFAKLTDSPSFARLAGLPRIATVIAAPDDAAGEGRTDVALGAIAREDARVGREVAEAHRQTITDLLVTDVGGVIDLDAIRQVKVGRRTREWRCLTEALYFEARGEEPLGQVAVAEVILNRVDDPRFPDTVCGVVRQGSGKKHQCQFSYWCDGRAERITEPEAFEWLGKVAWVMLQGKPRILTGKATFYHAASVSPKWARAMVRTGRIGDHIFYREPLRLSRR